MRKYTVSFVPHDVVQYDYTVEAKDEDQAYEKGLDELRWAIGRDASKDKRLMRCTNCNSKTKVLDSRNIGDGKMVKRRRQCVSCDTRFTTYEEAYKRRKK